MAEVPGDKFAYSYNAVRKFNKPIVYPRPKLALRQAGFGLGFLMWGFSNPTCVVSTVRTAGNAGIEAIIASDQTF